MKKKLSRLLCALLVLTMVLAMVPAVSAAGASGSDPIVLYKGEKTTLYVVRPHKFSHVLR